MDQGVISTFKAYYLRRTFRQLINKTDGENKQFITNFWKNYNIMDAVDNISLSWNEVTEKCLKRVQKNVWKNVWPQVSKDVDTRESIVDVKEIVKLANETELNNINAQDIEELLQVTTGESLSTTILKNQQNNKCTKMTKLAFLKMRSKRNGLFKKKFSPYNRNYESVYTK